MSRMPDRRFRFKSKELFRDINWFKNIWYKKGYRNGSYEMMKEINLTSLEEDNGE